MLDQIACDFQGSYGREQVNFKLLEERAVETLAHQSDKGIPLPILELATRS